MTSGVQPTVMTSNLAQMPFRRVESPATSLTLAETADQATGSRNGPYYRVDRLVHVFCSMKGRRYFAETLHQIDAELSSFRPRDVIEKMLLDAVLRHGSNFLRAQADTTLRDVNFVQEGEIFENAGVIPAPASASRNPSPPSSTSTQSSASGGTNLAPNKAELPLCAEIDVRCAEKKCPNCSLLTGKYGLKKHLESGCPKYCPDYGERKDANVIQYISTVHALVLCPGCNKWFRGHHQAQNANHAQNGFSESDEDEIKSAPSVIFGLSSNDLQGSNALAAIEGAAQEALAHPFGSGQDTYPVGQFNFPGASRCSNDFLNDVHSALTLPSFREFDEMEH